MKQKIKKFIAHKRESDGKEQTVLEHLKGAADYAKRYASKMGLAEIGELLGYLHDIGKYSSEFQNYIKSAIGILNSDEDEYVNAQNLKGKIDHSTSGAQLLWQKFLNKNPEDKMVAKILSLCIVSHHSGLIDCLSPIGVSMFKKRINKETHINEIIKIYDKEIKEKIDNILLNFPIVEQLLTVIKNIKAPKGPIGHKIRLYKIGQLLRILYSCLIDADRSDACAFEMPFTKPLLEEKEINWDILIDRLEAKLQEYKKDINFKPIDKIRSKISDFCQIASERKQGIFTLTVPTGGGKTLASLRFALLHAKKYKLDRIIFVVPFTTIIDQNADEVRKILEPDIKSSIILEHHSNLTPDEENWHGKILSENWNAPIIFTTSVQLLEALFSGGTQNVRRMHQLVNSLIIFDEIQTLPIKCTHMFNNTMNLLVESCNTSIVLCTATQPLLNKVDEEKGALSFNEKSEIIPDVKNLFDDLKRVEIIDYRKINGFSNKDIAKLANEKMKISGNCLVVANTKESALEIYKALSDISSELIYLSTNLCPAHRKILLNKIKEKLKLNLPLICVSTQLIEAGIDIDFGSVIRCNAGLDSIIQASGRCNRHGLKNTGNVYIVNNKDEKLNKLLEIIKGKHATERVLEDLKNDSMLKSQDILSPAALNRFFTYYFYNRREEMDYPISTSSLGRDDTLFNLLSANDFSIKEFKRNFPEESLDDPYLNQSFFTAGKIFKTIEAPTCGVIVPFDEGKNIINELCASSEIEKQYKLLKRAQQYSVNLYPHQFDKLVKVGAIKEIQKDSKIYFIDKQYYDNNFGVSNEPITFSEFLIA